ncbi:hypothetical protein ACTMU2_35285 [Cupriavidus basilensis]
MLHASDATVHGLAIACGRCRQAGYQRATLRQPGVLGGAGLHCHRRGRLAARRT